MGKKDRGALCAQAEDTTLSPHASSSLSPFVLMVPMSRWHIPGYPQPRAPSHLLLCGIIHINIEQGAQVGQVEDGQGSEEQV